MGLVPTSRHGGMAQEIGTSTGWYEWALVCAEVYFILFYYHIIIFFITIFNPKYCRYVGHCGFVLYCTISTVGSVTHHSQKKQPVSNHQNWKEKLLAISKIKISEFMNLWSKWYSTAWISGHILPLHLPAAGTVWEILTCRLPVLNPTYIHEELCVS